MHGPLHEIGLIEVLQLLARGQRTGTLRVTGPDPERVHDIALADGVIVAIDPDANDQQTRAALVRRHLVAGRDAQEDIEVMRSPIASAMRHHLARQGLHAMLHWQRGRFDFTPSTAAGPLSLVVDRVILDLVASESRRVDLAEGTADFHAVPDFAPPDILGAGDPVDLTPADWRVLDLIDGVRDVAALAAALDDPLEEVAASILKLHGSAILELQQPMPGPALGARIAMEAGRYDDAVGLLRDRLAQQPNDSDAWRTLGLAEVGAGRFEQAIEAWQSWRAGDPEHAGDAAMLMQAARTMVEALRDSRD